MSVLGRGYSLSDQPSLTLARLCDSKDIRHMYDVDENLVIWIREEAQIFLQESKANHPPYFLYAFIPHRAGMAKCNATKAPDAFPETCDAHLSSCDAWIKLNS